MRGKFDVAPENARRVPADLLQRDTLKVVNMMDLARELSGGTAAAPIPATDEVNPADFWKQKLAGWHSPTPIPCTVPPTPPTARKPALHVTQLSESEAERLRRAAEVFGVPMPLLFQAAWALLLQRYSGEDDVVFGTVKGCFEREASREESAVHIVPARVTFTGSPNVAEWLKQLAEQAREAAPFEFIPLASIREAVGAKTDQPLFESVLGIGHQSFDPLTIATAHAQADQSHAEADTYPLVAAAYVHRDISLHVAYSPQRFSERAIQLLTGHWITLLKSLADSPSSSLEKVTMITPEERDQVTVDWNATQRSWPSTACAHQLFEEQVTRTPNGVALRFGEKQMSYRELNDSANALAHRLHTRGIGPDSVVGICLERSFQMIISVLGVLKAGAAYLPLDPSYPQERLQFMLSDSRAALLLTQTNLQSIAAGSNVSAICLDANWSAPTGRIENPVTAVTPENLAYLIYTSGSTGKPKGVAMVHRPLVNLIHWQLAQSRLGVGDRTLQFTSLSFDVSFQEIFATLCSGGTLILIPADLRLNPRELWNLCACENVARIFLPFVALQQMADAASASGVACDALREVITAGEQLQVTPRLRELFTRHSQATLHNHYGPSETHVVTALTLEGDPRLWPDLPAIGRPIQNTQIHILDRSGSPMPIGLPGELFIGGVALARGYFERPEVTAEKFIHNPFSEQPSQRLYRTGDLARWLPDGNIEFLGRIDHQIKIRGYRVELGEIEAVLAKQTGVREGVVVAREGAGGGKQLVAYVVRTPNSTITPNLLRQCLKSQLPEYMVPAAFVFLDRLPLTPSGKVDRKSLPAPDTTSAPSGSDAPVEQPWLPIHFQLLGIWEEILGIRPSGVRDNFFELGGHSLLAVRMMDRVEQVTGRKLPVNALFAEPTIAHLSQLILDGAPPATSPVIELRTTGTRKPLYFLHGDIIGGGFYARDIARLLDAEQPFYVLPPSDFPADTLPTVEEMATEHLQILRAHRPHGPYLLGGFCIGALVAYEMAHRLRAAGEDVPFLALIDPQLSSKLLRANYHLVERLAKSRHWDAGAKTRVFARGHKVLYRLREEWNAPWQQKRRFISQSIGRLFGRTVESEQKPTQAQADNSHIEQQKLAAFHWIITAYTPPKYSGPTDIFLTDEQVAFAPFLANRWSKAVGDVHVHRVPGEHLGAITTHVAVLSAMLEECLRERMT